MTRIGLDLVFLAPGATGGMETYARSLVPQLARQRPSARWVVFCGRELAAELRSVPWCDRLEVVQVPVSSATRVRRVAVEQTLLPALIRRAQVDLLHSLGNTAPLAPGGPPLVLTIHDLIWARVPETHAGLLARGLEWLVPRAARRAAAIVAVSRATANDVERLIGLAADRVHVVRSGPGSVIGRPTPEPKLRDRLALGSAPLVLCPSPCRAHKNVNRLVAATAGLGATVVVPGYASTRDVAPRDEPHVRYLGWVSDADMEGLYSAATLLAFPSLAEGFGLPVLEAMRRGLPVACADATSLPEIAGGAALLFDPLDEGAIRSAVLRLLSDESLRKDLARRGRAQAANFSWERAAEATWSIYDRVLGVDPPEYDSHGLVRRIAGHPRVVPVTALALRSRTVKPALAFTARELRGGGHVGAYRVRGASIDILVRHGAGDAATVGEVFHERHYEPPPRLDAHLDPRMIVDLGANIGLFGAFASARWPHAHIVGYEPDPANADLCAACIDRNHLRARWELRRYAASDRDETLRFHASHDALSRADETGELLVEARDVLPEIGHADLVKMDIEGGEWAILADPRLVAATPRALVLEYHPYRCPQPDPHAAVHRLLDAAGLVQRSSIFARSDGHGMLWAWRD